MVPAWQVCSRRGILSERFERVVVIERDVLPPIGEHRRGVPHGRHLHGLHPRGREILVCEPHVLTIPKSDEPVSICVLYREKETDRGTICETYDVVATTAVPEDAVVLAVM